METLIRYEKVKDIIIKNIIFKDGQLSKKKMLVLTYSEAAGRKCS